MSVGYTVQFSTGRDNVFNVDATADVLGMEWRRGMTAAYEHVAQPTRGVVTLKNTSGTYLSLGAGATCQIRASVGFSTPKIMFMGYIRYTEITMRGKATIHVEGMDAWLHTESGTIGPQVNVRADEVITDLLSDAQWPPIIPYANYIVVSLGGQNGIDSGLLIYTPNLELTTETGRSTFAYVGDTWREGAPMIDIIREVVTSERGRFFLDKSGILKFYNRHYTMLNTTRRATYEKEILNWRYAFGADILNRVEVGITPRRIGPDNTVVYRNTQPMQVDAGVTRRVIVRYADDDGNRIGALSIQQPPTYTATTTDGIEVSAFLEVAVERIGVNAAKLTLTNLTPIRLVLSNLEIRGVPLITEDPLIVVAESGQSRTAYGPRHDRLWLPAVTDIDEAQAVADYELRRRTFARGWAKEITVRADAPDALEMDLFDRIQVVNMDETGHEADYLICGEYHQITPSFHRITWVLEPAEQELYIIIDKHGVNDTTRLIAPF